MTPIRQRAAHTLRRIAQRLHPAPAPAPAPAPLDLHVTRTTHPTEVLSLRRVHDWPRFLSREDATHDALNATKRELAKAAADAATFTVTTEDDGLFQTIHVHAELGIVRLPPRP
ncbi:hypothetical protein [Deinococcus kurensis]|uniref:hypothetical protein n=1 Tax=Deinococcus kurensis TaxID=2662757 RepID=UPI0012D2AC5C|nr:hypothetical protein [Deinococcus kurensis]